MCIHKHATLVQTAIEADAEVEAATIAVYQCDMCGETLLDRDIGNVDDLLTLPVIDLEMQRQALQRIWKPVLATINKSLDY